MVSICLCSRLLSTLLSNKLGGRFCHASKGAVSHGAPRMGCGMRNYHTSEFQHDASRMAWTSQVSLKKASPSQHLVSKPVASLSCTAALGTTCQVEQQTMQNKSAVVNKAPIESKDKALTPKLDDGGTGGGSRQWWRWRWRWR